MSGDSPKALRKVVGVQLSAESPVPVVILKAAGAHVDHVIEQGRKHEIPVIESGGLTAGLYRIPIDNAVTPDLFPLMAALLAHVIHVDRAIDPKPE